MDVRVPTSQRCLAMRVLVAHLHPCPFEYVPMPPASGPEVELRIREWREDVVVEVLEGAGVSVLATRTSDPERPRRAHRLARLLPWRARG